MTDPLALLFDYLSRDELPPEHVRKAAARRYVDLEAAADARKLASRERGASIARLRAAGTSWAALAERTGLTPRHMRRLMRRVAR